MRPFSVLLAVLAVLAAVPGSAAAHKPPNRPLVFAVVVDGLDGDSIDAGAAPFISSLINGDRANTTYYRESRSIMVSETNPNHTAMMTGAYADRSGIAGNNFAIYRNLAGEEENEAAGCAPAGPVNLRALPTVTDGEDAGCVKGETVFEAIKRQGNPEAYATAGIFGKAKLGRLFAGRQSNDRFFADHLWAPCTPDDSATERRYCASVPLEPVNNDRTILDSVVMDEMVRAVRQGVGHDRRPPDFAFVNLPNVDNAGHLLGGGGLGYELAIGLADAEIERLVGALRSQDLWGRSVLILLSDHAHDTTLQSRTMTDVLQGAGIPSSEFLVVDNGGADMVYLANRKAKSRFSMLKRMRAAALATPGVDMALYREPNPRDGGRANTIAGRFPGWHADGKRSGDLLVLAKPGIRFSEPGPFDNPLLGNHGGWNTLDNAFLISSGGAMVRHATLEGRRDPRFADTRRNPRQAENVDVASTALGLLGLAETRSNRGRFLGEAFNKRFLPGRTRPSIEPLVSAAALPAGRSRWRVRASWAPWESVWQVQVGRAGTGEWRTIRNRTRKRRASATVSRRGRYILRVRAISASGAKGYWSKRAFVAR